MTHDGPEARHGEAGARDTEQELRLLRAELRKTRRQLAVASFERDAAQAAIARMKEQLRTLRRSSSWRVTRPLRMFKRKTAGRGAF